MLFQLVRPQGHLVQAAHPRGRYCIVRIHPVVKIQIIPKNIVPLKVWFLKRRILAANRVFFRPAGSARTTPRVFIMELTRAKHARGSSGEASSKFNKTRSPINASVKEKAVFWVQEKEIPARPVDTLGVWKWACPLEQLRPDATRMRRGPRTRWRSEK